MFNKDTCLEKERVRSKVTPRKVGVVLKPRQVLNKRRLGWRLAWWGSTKKKEVSHLIIDEKREKYRAKNGSLQNISTDSKGTTFVILINHARVPDRKEKLGPTSKSKREGSQNKFVKKGGVPGRVKSFREIKSRQYCPRARPGFVKPIRNGLRNKQNLMESRPSRAETGLAGRENGVQISEKRVDEIE